MQTQTAIDPSLAALLQTAKMVTPDGGDTVAAQYAQAAQQKMQPQGIMQNMQGAKQDYAAAAPSMMRNMQQAQVQQMMQQAMQPQPAGIEGLPAQNMQGMQRMAEGGVVGYAGSDGSFVTPQKRPDETFEEFRQRTIAEQEAVQQKRRDTARAKAEEERIAEMARRGMAPRSPFVQTPAAPTPQAPIPEGSDRRLDIPAGGIVSPGMAQAAPPRPPAPRPSPQPSQPASTATPATGIAAAVPVAMTPEEAMGSTRAMLGTSGAQEAFRSANEAARLAREQRPMSGQAGLAALQEQMNAVRRMEEERKRTMASDRVIAQLLGGRGRPGSLAEADIRFMAGKRAEEDAFYERNAALAAKQDAINDANEARKVGDKEKYAEAKQKELDADRAIAQTEATLSAAI